MMADARRGSSERRTRPPLWVVEGLDVVERRRLVLLAVTGTIVVVGALLAWLAPGIVPPRAGVGAAIAVAALLLGLAAAVAIDATDLYIRGPRHVSAAGGELVAVLSQSATAEEAVPLAAAVFEAREPDQPLLLGLAASGKDSRATVAWTDALAIALEAEGASVLRIDLASGASEPPGLAEVVHEGAKLAGAVTFGPEPRLARLGAGADHAAALDALTTLPGRLPRDLDVLLVALPMAASRQVVGAVRSLDHILIVAQCDRTSRVELIAGLDALEAAGTRAQVALVDERTAARLGAGSTPAKQEPTPSAGFTAHSPAGGQATVDASEVGSDEAGSGESGSDDADSEAVGGPAYDEIVNGPAKHDVDADEAPAGVDPGAQAAPDATPGADVSPGAQATPDVTPDADVSRGFGAAPDVTPGADVSRGVGAVPGDAGTVASGSDIDDDEPEAGDRVPDPDDTVASDARSADVLNAAAAAAALAQVVSDDAPMPERFEEDARDADDPDAGMPARIEPTAPIDATEATEATEATDSTGPTEPTDSTEATAADGDHLDTDPGDDARAQAAGEAPGEAPGQAPGQAAGEEATEEVPGDADRTDELPRVDGSPAVRRGDDDHDDMLRTTAQLSVLMDDLDDQGR